MSFQALSILKCRYCYDVKQPYDVYEELAVIGGSHAFFVHHNISAVFFHSSVQYCIDILTLCSLIVSKESLVWPSNPHVVVNNNSITLLVMVKREEWQTPQGFVGTARVVQSAIHPWHLLVSWWFVVAFDLQHLWEESGACVLLSTASTGRWVFSPQIIPDGNTLCPVFLLRIWQYTVDLCSQMPFWV